MDEKDKKVANSLINNNLQELKDEVTAGAEIEERMQKEAQLDENAVTTRTQAPQILAKETNDIPGHLDTHDGRSHKVFIVVAIAVVLLCIVGLIFVLILVGNHDRGQEGSPSDGLAQNEKEEISIEDATVQDLYQSFLPRVLQSFYEAELSHDDSRKMEKGRLEIAMTNTVSTECKGSMGVSELCYPGEIVKAKYEELFGNKIELTVEKYGEIEGEPPLFVYVDAISQMDTFAYDGGADEFYQRFGGYDNASTVLSRLEKAYRDADELTLIERVLVVQCRPDPQFDVEGNLIEVGEGSACEVKPIADEQNGATFGWTGSDKAMKDEEIFTEAERLEIGGVKVIFQKNVDGKYVFKGMEAIVNKENSKIEELSLEDETVKELYAVFGSTYLEHNPITALVLLEDFYPVAGFKTVDEITDIQKYAMVLQSIGFYNDTYKTQCKGDYDFMHWVDENGVEHTNQGRHCLSGNVMRARSKELFGRELDLRQFDGVDNMTIIDGEGIYYSADNDEAMVRASGATYQEIERRPYKVEKDDDRLFIYEVVGRIGCWASGQTDCTGYKMSGEAIPDSQNLNYENMLERLADLDKFKWTFKKDGDENYILESIERVEE